MLVLGRVSRSGVGFFDPHKTSSFGARLLNWWGELLKRANCSMSYNTGKSTLF